MVSIAFICFAVPLALMLPILQGRSRWLVTYLLAGSYIAVCAGAVNGMIRQALGITSLELSLSVAPIVEEIARERTDIKVGKVNVDEQPELAGQFGVMSIPTLVVIKNGQIVNQSVGAKPKNAILAML